MHLNSCLCIIFMDIDKQRKTCFWICFVQNLSELLFNVEWGKNGVQEIWRGAWIGGREVFWSFSDLLAYDASLRSLQTKEKLIRSEKEGRRLKERDSYRNVCPLVIKKGMEVFLRKKKDSRYSRLIRVDLKRSGGSEWLRDTWSELSSASLPASQKSYKSK